MAGGFGPVDPSSAQGTENRGGVAHTGQSGPYKGAGFSGQPGIKTGSQGMRGRSGGGPWASQSGSKINFSGTRMGFHAMVGVKKRR